MAPKKTPRRQANRSSAVKRPGPRGAPKRLPRVNQGDPWNNPNLSDKQQDNARLKFITAQTGTSRADLMAIDAMRKARGIGAYGPPQTLADISPEMLAKIQASPQYQAANPGTAGGAFSIGVSGQTGAFIKEAGGGPPGEEAEDTGPTKNKKKKAQRKKLVKRVVKKTNVKGKAVRRALRSKGVTKSDKKVYRKVAQQATPKLSSRLRVADRRKKK